MGIFYNVIFPTIIIKDIYKAVIYEPYINNYQRILGVSAQFLRYCLQACSYRAHGCVSSL